MSGRRSRARGRARSNRIQDCYGEAAGNVDNRPAFDTTPFDPNTAGSAWDTLPTQSIFHSSDASGARSPTDWLSCPEPNEMVPNMTSSSYVAASGYSGGTASPCLRKVQGRSSTPGRRPLNSTNASASGRSRLLLSRPSESCSPSPSLSGANSTRASGFDSSRRSTGLSGISQFDDDIDVNDHDEYNIFATSRRIHLEPPPQEPIVVDTSPLPPWKPHRASERLEDPNNPPPMFHPMFANEWRTDPNISEEMRNMYASSCSEYSGNHCIFDYGKLSEFNTQNLYDPERFAGLNEQGGRTPAYKNAYCTAVFGDPHEALDRPTDDVPDKYRKEKWHYFELKKRLELFKQLGMETDLAMYEGQLERMEADPWTGDDSGRDVQVYMRGMEGDPALDDELLEQMEALVAPENEGRKAFYAAMANPPPIRDETAASPDCEMAQTITQAMENPPSGAKENSVLNDSFHTCFEGDDSQMGDIDLNESFHTCVEGNDTQMEDLLNTTFSLPDTNLNASFSLPDTNLNASFSLPDTNLNASFSLPDTNLNASFTLPEGATVDFPPGVGPDDC